ncbi:peptidyl-prolyl cis-trans isomerase [Gracilimonas amylolytica]|uniref:peptidyl-prolyl cis-trans isomerase n=1 Tax=Gracilimonas amylolytica TaxID=1749045 RepID=UPI000CD84099|nr:peptidyl-prolyl cis-trans isomerase [Gracilimonas amylolytica]
MRIKILPLLLIALVMTQACQTNSSSETVILAEVGNMALTKSEAESFIPKNALQADSSLALKKYTDDWVRKQVILQEADRLNFANRRDVRERLKRVQDEFMLQAVQDYIISEFEDDMSVSELEARNYYQQNKEKFTLEEQYVQYRHVVTETMADAQNAKRELMRGTDWETVAKRYSKYADLKIRESQKFWPISISGGDVNMLNRYLRVNGPSEISPIYRSGNEYHFVQLIEERPEGDHPDLDWLIEQIREWLTLEKRKRAFNTYVKNLYLQAQANNEIKIYNQSEESSSAFADTVSLN